MRRLLLLGALCGYHVYGQLYIAQERQFPEVRAFLDVIACVEGTYDNGYNIKFGGERFSGYADHPREQIPYTLKGERYISTAAGRYQFHEQEWDAIRKRIDASKFTPLQQDYAMVYLLRASRALDYVKQRKVYQALEALRPYKHSVAKLLTGGLPHCSVRGLYATFAARQRQYASQDRRMPDVLSVYLQKPYVRAFLDVIATAEGTYKRDGYYICFPDRRCDTLAYHPNVVTCAQSQGKTLCSSAAGRYQLLKGTWHILAWRIGAQNFLPREQDRAVVQMLLDRHIIDALENGDLERALQKANKGWASLPGSPHQQPRASHNHVQHVFNTQYANYAK